MSIQSVLLAHLARYPRMAAQDIYKLIHQAALGSEHATPNPQIAQARLEQELREISNPYTEPAIDPISPDGAIARVHLSAFMAQGGKMAQLCQAFLRTGREYHGAQALLETYLQAALPLVPDLQNILPALKEQGYPALHHSAAYRAHYRPAYRVVLREFL